MANDVRDERSSGKYERSRDLVAFALMMRTIRSKEIRARGFLVNPPPSLCHGKLNEASEISPFFLQYFSIFFFLKISSIIIHAPFFNSLIFYALLTRSKKKKKKKKLTVDQDNYLYNNNVYNNNLKLSIYKIHIFISFTRPD